MLWDNKLALLLFWEFFRPWTSRLTYKIATLTNLLVMNEGVNFITEPFPEQFTSVFPVFRDLSKKEVCKKKRKEMRRRHSWLGWVAASEDKIPQISNQGPLTTHKFYSHNFPFLVFKPWNKHILKHREDCKSCQSQVTWKVKFECQFCPVLSCPDHHDHYDQHDHHDHHDHEEVGSYMRKLEVVWSHTTSDLLV